MKVLSLFDGKSCGRVALDVANIPVTTYYASEVDKYAMQISSKNYNDIVQLGDVTNWRNWSLDWAGIDLLIAGSPCQGFSFSGKQLAFDDPRSALFFEFVAIKRHISEARLRAGKTDVWFLLENVRMKKQYLDVISQQLAVEPVFINSNLTSAQNRPRYYWANWPIQQPDDQGIMLCDIVEHEVDEKYLISENYKRRLSVSDALKKRFSAINPDKALCMTARQYANWKGTLVVALTERRTEEAKRIRSQMMKEQGKDFSPRRGKELTPRTDGKMNCLTATFSNKEHTLFDENNQYRKLTPVECERLQCLPDNYTQGVSDAQRYKMIGNGWTISVIAHIFSQLQ